MALSATCLVTNIGGFIEGELRKNTGRNIYDVNDQDDEFENSGVIGTNRSACQVEPYAMQHAKTSSL